MQRLAEVPVDALCLALAFLPGMEAARPVARRAAWPWRSTGWAATWMAAQPSGTRCEDNGAAWERAQDHRTVQGIACDLRESAPLALSVLHARE